MNIIYLGCNGFPYGFAQIQKQKMISKALVLKGEKVTIINTKGILDKATTKLHFKGNVDGINYIFTSLTAFRPKNFFIRTFFKVFGRINEFFTIVFLKKRHTKNIAIISTKKKYLLIYYSFVLHIMGYKVILSYEEYVESLSLKKHKVKFDEIAYNYCDGILPISTYLNDLIKSKNKKVITLKIPVLTDFDLIDSVLFDGAKEKFILFCGSSTCFENICFILKSFDFVKDTSINLILILHGDYLQIQRINLYIKMNSLKNDKISVLSNLLYEDLIMYYKKSSILLIPLKPDVRDMARFPHKIAEYTASKTPILTTSVGEINQYFTNNVNAFIVDKYDPVHYGEKIDFIFSHKTLSLFVAQNAYELGRSKFHFESISDNLTDFIYHI